MSAKRQPFSDLEVDQIESMAACGLTVDRIALVLRMKKRAFQRRLKITPNGPDTIEKGRAKAENNVAKSAYNMAISGKHPAMTMFWLKCRAGWKEGQGPQIVIANTPESPDSSKNVSAEIKKLMESYRQFNEPNLTASSGKGLLSNVGAKSSADSVSPVQN